MSFAWLLLLAIVACNEWLVIFIAVSCRLLFSLLMYLRHLVDMLCNCQLVNNWKEYKTKQNKIITMDTKVNNLLNKNYFENYFELKIYMKKIIK